jgi:hypothetical protein
MNMPLVKVRVDDKTYSRLVKMRIKAGLPSVPALLLDRCGLLTDDKEAQEIVRQAKRRALQKPSGTRFLVRDLFKDHVWNQFSKGARIKAGKRFHQDAARAVDGIRIDKKSGSGHQYYEIA